MKTAAIRTHLLMLVLAVSVPLVAAVAYGIYLDMQQAIDQAKTSLRTLAVTMVGNTGRTIQDARDVLERLARRTEVRLVDAKRCDPLLRELQTLRADYANVVVTDVNGLTVCSALGLAAGGAVSVGHMAWFQDFIQARRFTVGQPHRGPISGKWVSVLSAPVWSERAELLGAVHLSLEVNAFNPRIPAQFLPDESRYGFFRDDGIMVWRNADPEGVIGTRPNAVAARQIVETRDGEFESLAVDGVVRFFSVVPMPEVGWVVFVGVPASSVYVEARRNAVKATGLALLAVLTLFGLAMAMARRITRPIVELERTARAVHQGDLAVRAMVQGPREIAAVAREFNAMVAVQEQIRNLAFLDPLTKLPNRRLLLDRLQRALTSSARSGCQAALLYIDLDNFKSLNDTQGHDQGDLLLNQVAARLTTCVREGDTVARLGGDEFVILLEGLSALPHEAATQIGGVGKKVLAALNLPYDLDGHECYSTPSIGATLIADHRLALDELLKQADLAMYEAKTAGRNTLRFFDPDMQHTVTARAAMERELREGLREGHLLLHYQVQVNADGQPTGAEALVRWQHPQRGLVLPLDFIPLAEATGLILPLGHWVLQIACQQLALWATRAETASLCMAVNVSARQFRQGDFVAQVLAVLAQTGADPRKLKLELTESLLLDDVEAVIQKMATLKASGVGFALDDFGTGYSSLAYLKRLPLEQIKIDRSFVRDILFDPNDAAIARTIIALGQSLGLAVIAEGVESAAQRDHLASHGCLAYQGYHFGRPMPLVDFEQCLRQR